MATVNKHGGCRLKARKSKDDSDLKKKMCGDLNHRNRVVGSYEWLSALRHSYRSQLLGSCDLNHQLKFFLDSSSYILRKFV